MKQKEGEWRRRDESDLYRWDLVKLILSVSLVQSTFMFNKCDELTAIDALAECINT